MKRPTTEEEYWAQRDLRVEAARDRALFQPQKEKPMAMIKRYLENIICDCSEELFGQEAVEWAITTGRVHLTYRRGDDLQVIMKQYDQIIEAYQEERRNNCAVLMLSYQPIIEQLKAA